jgi:hypothetical protein
MKKRRKSHVDIQLFTRPTLISVAYILGFLWADGCIAFANNTPSRVVLKIQSEDASEIEGLVQSTGTWLTYHDHRRLEWKPTTTFQINSTLFAGFLADLDYLSKHTTPTKVLELIPPELQRYWYRGYIDGDGCFYHHKPRYLYRFHTSGPYNQDWSFMQNLFARNNLHYTITHKENKKGHRSSSFNCDRRKNIIYLGNLLYGNTWDGIGLCRKYNKFLSIAGRLTV